MDDEAGAAVSGRPANYPAQWESVVALADGGTVEVRPILPSDADRLVDFHGRQSSESIYFRFFSPKPRLLPRDIERFTHIDYADRMAFVAILGDQLIALAGYDRRGSNREAEVAFIIDDEQKRRGLATVLLEFLIVAAREAGMSGLFATVLPNNRAMLSVLHGAGFATRSEFADGVVEVSIAMEPSDEAQAASEDRAQRAEARSVQRLLSPGSIAVVGASHVPGRLGNELVRVLVEHGYQGPVYPVNRSGEAVHGIDSHRSVLDIDADVDLAVITVPALEVADVVEQCGRHGVDGIIVVSSGFGAFGYYGEVATEVIVEGARRFGMRVIGPESLGVINTDPALSMHATFADTMVAPGRVGFLTQSGTLGVAALEHARRVGLGVSSFVDVGRKIDVSGNDLLQYWQDDPGTDVVAMYLESFGNPRKFTRIARRLGKRKPIVAVKSGTDRLLSDDARDADLPEGWPLAATTDALLEQAGVVRVGSPVEMFDVCRVLAQQPVPSGRRVAIVSNSRGAATISVDACIGAGLELAAIDATTRGRITVAGAPAWASRANPIDLTHAAGPDLYAATMEAVLDDDGVDAVLVIYAPSFPRADEAVSAAIGDGVRRWRAGSDDGNRSVDRTGKAVVASLLGADLAQPPTSGDEVIPLFEFPAEASKALAGAARYGEWRDQPLGTIPSIDDVEAVDLTAARERVRAALTGADEALDLAPPDLFGLLEVAGLGLHDAQLVADDAELVGAGRSLGFPVALKATGLDARRPGELGGAALSIHDEHELVDTYHRMLETFGDDMRPASVQSMVTGAEVAVTAHQHASFGAVITLGLGGPARSAAVDPVLAVLPMSDLDAARLIARSPVAGLLDDVTDDGVGAAHLAGLLVRLGLVVDHLPELAYVVLNPVSVNATGARVLDGRVRVAPYRFEPSSVFRRLG